MKLWFSFSACNKGPNLGRRSCLPTVGRHIMEPKLGTVIRSKFGAVTCVDGACSEM